MSRRRVAALAPLALALALGCHPKGQPVAPTTAGGGGGSVDDQTPLAPVTKMAELLPPKTLALLEVAGPRRVMEIVGRDALVAAFPQEYAQITRDMASSIGTDIFDPAKLREIGVDLEGRMGAAVIAAEPFTVAFFVPVADAGRFRQFMFDAIRRNRGDVVPVPLAGAEVLRIKDKRAALVLRGPYAVFVIRDGDGPGDPALELAGADPHTSLANDRGYRKATGALGVPDGIAYVDAAAVATALAGGETPSKPSNWAADELAAAKERGETPARIQELEQQAAQIEADQARWEKRRHAERTLRERLLLGIGRAAWAFNAKPTGIVAEGRIEYGGEAAVRSLLRNRAGEPALIKSLDGRPVWLMEGAFQVSELVAFADLALQADGTSWAELVAELKRDLAIDLDGELRPLLTGNASFAVTLDGALDPMPTDLRAQLGASVDIELADAEQAAAMLERLGKLALAQLGGKGSKNPKPIGKLTRGKDGTWSLAVPQWRTLEIAVRGHHLVISTDRGFGKRLQAGAAGDIKTKGQPAAIAAASLTGAAIGALLDLEAIAIGTSARFGGFATASMFEDPWTATVPKSKAYKAKQRELDRAQARIDELEQRRSAEEVARIGRAVRPWGSLAGNAVVEGDGVLVRGGLFVRGKDGVAGTLLESLKAIKAMQEPRAAQQDLDEAFRKADTLRGELNAIRQKDIEAYERKHPRPSGGAVVPNPQ
ncbi:MAG: hypothetical protein IPK74_22805 [Deltaproteobacteria bacterium]|nr:hypothetical protein [Deltaproteobacteria bacterium]